MGSEFIEEYSQSIIDTALRNAVFGEDNEIKVVSEEAIYEGMIGALTALGMEAPGIAVNTYVDNAIEREMYREKVDALKKAGKNVDLLERLRYNEGSERGVINGRERETENGTGKGFRTEISQISGESRREKAVEGRLPQNESFYGSLELNTRRRLGKDLRWSQEDYSTPQVDSTEICRHSGSPLPGINFISTVTNHKRIIQFWKK